MWTYPAGTAENAEEMRTFRRQECYTLHSPHMGFPSSEQHGWLAQREGSQTGWKGKESKGRKEDSEDEGSGKTMDKREEQRFPEWEIQTRDQVTRASELLPQAVETTSAQEKGKATFSPKTPQNDHYFPVYLFLFIVPNSMESFLCSL